jgi:ribosome-binding ATPase YchF (GTP1/OBG family)
MKIGFHGLPLPEGKIRYNDSRLQALKEKLQPDKFSPFFAEFIQGEMVQCDGIIIHRENLLDLLILDMEKLETRVARSDNDAEKALIGKCMELLEDEQVLCDISFNDEEKEILQGLAPLSYSPTAVVDEIPDTDTAVEIMLKATGTMFFYTAGKQEVRAWPVADGADAVTCAGKIHSDLAGGFIKADVVDYHDFMSVYNMQEARKKNLVKLVDRDHPIKDGSIIEIRFNV